MSPICSESHSISTHVSSTPQRRFSDKTDQMVVDRSIVSGSRKKSNESPTTPKAHHSPRHDHSKNETVGGSKLQKSSAEKSSERSRSQDRSHGQRSSSATRSRSTGSSNATTGPTKPNANNRQGTGRNSADSKGGQSNNRGHGHLPRSASTPSLQDIIPERSSSTAGRSSQSIQSFPNIVMQPFGSSDSDSLASTQHTGVSTADVEAARIIADDYDRDVVGCAQGCKNSPNSVTAFLSLGLLATAISALISYLDPEVVPEYVLKYVLPVVYGIYLLEALFRSKTLTYLRRVWHRSRVRMHYEKIVASQPWVVWIIQCYHFETRVHYDSNGGRHTRRVRVNTHSATKTNYIVDWEDSSNPFCESKAKMTKLKFKKIFTWSSDEDENAHTDAYQSWIAFHDRDAHYDSSKSYGYVRLS